MYLKAGMKALTKIGNKRGAKRFEAMLEDESGDNNNASTPATDKDIMAILALKKDITDSLTTSLKQYYGCSSRTAQREAKTVLETLSKEILNNAHWETIHDSFSFDGKTFDSTLIPAGQIKLGEKDIFATGYDDKGVCSKSSDETTHAVNLWISRFSARDDDQRPLFTGIRHGVLSPYELEAGSAERRQGALNRAREVVAAALYLHPEKMAAALKGDKVDLPLTSSSLLTPVNIAPSTEKSQLRDQMSAWNELGAGPAVIPIRDGKGNVVPVTVRLDIAAFNFGVNEPALGWLKLGHAYSDKYNHLALAKLLGRDLSPGSPHGGWVGQYLASRPANAERVRALAAELKLIWAKKLHHADKGEPYKAAMRVALLSSEIGVTPCWNCKSGKDRTGMLDAEIKRATAGHALGMGTDSGALDMGGRQLMQAVMLNSGNMQIQQYNTGVPGNKSLKNNKLANVLIGGLTLRDRIGNPEIANLAKGLSDYV
ncbi:inositol phosphate phosphatase SopB [Acerihabitans arboris]|uniref:Inositol phosphatase n=1 Tax=Acerihabitans arboris TaxID=2691583 RepID=A0A845SKW6_9GAMM|nr:inositol phosphate phosphatase SopB [Acerihabitans arboris]NDL65570.1 inositol phosphatase [Acerihabitans arboris]